VRIVPQLESPLKSFPQSRGIAAAVEDGMYDHRIRFHTVKYRVWKSPAKHAVVGANELGVNAPIQLQCVDRRESLVEEIIANTRRLDFVKLVTVD
jgi:hypothetical protein